MKKLILMFLAFISLGVNAQDSPGVYTVENVKINTNYSDFGTAFLGDNKIVFAAPKEGFTMNREEYNSQPFLDLYMGEVTDDGQLIHKQKMPGEINTKFHEGMVTFSKDMKTVYFSANGKIKRVKRNKNNEVKTAATATIQLFKASIDENGEWGNLEMLPFNSTKYSTGHPVLNRDDTKLYFVSDRPESFGKTDLFVVDVYPDGTYGEPVNLGPEINTPEREMFPFIGKDNVLYFSTDGRSGYGELDVFASKIFDNTVSVPINLEEPVNSAMDDFAYIIDDTKNKGYFSSNREGGKGDDDIYSFVASPPINIECKQEISGVVKNVVTQERIPNVKILLFDEEGAQLKTFLSDENDASFSFSQSCNTTYKVKGYLEGYLIGELDIKTANDLNAEPIEIVMNMEVDPSQTLDVIASLDEADPAQNESTEVATSALAENDDVKDQSTEQLASEQRSSEQLASDEFTGMDNADPAQIEPAVIASSVVIDKNVEDDHDAMNDAMESKEFETEEPQVVFSESDGSGEGAENMNRNQIDSTTFEDDNVAVSDAKVKQVSSNEESMMAGSEIEDSETEKSEIAGDRMAITNSNQVDATTFEEDNVAVGEPEVTKQEANQEAMSSGSKLTFNNNQAQVKIDEKNGMNINTIYFDFNKSNIRYDAKLELDKLVVLLRENPDMKIEVNSHTDIRGTEKYNAKLSNSRANETIKFLTDNGIDSRRISGRGYGELQVAQKCTKEKPCTGLQHQLNRRSEFVVVEQNSGEIVLKSNNRSPSLNADNNEYTSNSGQFTNYNFYDDNQVYTVQVGAFKGTVQTHKYSKVTSLFNHRYDDGLNRYYSGVFKTSSEAKNHLKQMRQKGFSDAFVVGLSGENRF